MRTRTRASQPLHLDAVILRCAVVGADCSSLPPFALPRPGRPGSSRCDRSWERAGGSAAAVPRLLSGRVPCGTAIPSERETRTRDSERALRARCSLSSSRSRSRWGTAELRRLVRSGATGRAQLSRTPKKAPCLLRPSELTAVSEVGGSREEERLVFIIFVLWEAGVAPLVSWRQLGEVKVPDVDTHAGEAAVQRAGSSLGGHARWKRAVRGQVLPGHCARCLWHIPRVSTVCAGGKGQKAQGLIASVLSPWRSTSCNVPGGHRSLGWELSLQASRASHFSLPLGRSCQRLHD